MRKRDRIDFARDGLDDHEIGEYHGLPKTCLYQHLPLKFERY